MNAPEPRIADALREIAAEAPAPGRMADAAWQAGRRRRRRGLAAAVTAGAGAIAAVIALILAVVGGPAQSGEPTLAAGPVTLSMPIQFRQVAAIRTHGCPANSPAVPGPATAPASSQHAAGTACYTFTQRGMTVTRLKSAAVAKQPGGDGYLILIRFLPGDAARFAALASKLVGLPSPHCQLAAIVGDRVISAPTVDADLVVRGQVQILGFTSRAQAEHLLGNG